MSPRPTWYVSDLDGTLLRPDATLSERSRACLLEILAADVPFTVASARSLISIRQILGDLPLQLPVVAHNGAVVGELATAAPWRVLGLAPALATAVLDCVREHGQQPILTTHDGSLEHLCHQAPDNAGQRAYLDERRLARDPRLRPLTDVAGALADQVITVTIIGEREPLDELHRALVRLEGLHAHLFDDLYAPGWRWITVHPAAATKATGLGAIAARAGLQDHALVVFGDQVNDLSMFEAADTAYAVAGAAPVVAAAADGHLGSNADDAVARWLRRQLS